MAGPDRALMRRGIIAVWLTLAAAAPASAQQAQSRPVDFLTRFDFHLSAAALSNDDPRFSWDTHFGGELDAVDYGLGRTWVRIDFQAILGNEQRAFDPNQGNYTLELSTSARTPIGEVAGVFHHVSRHLGDRAKTIPIAWNLVGVRVLEEVPSRFGTTGLELGASRITQRSFVDYTWVGDAGVTFRRTLTPRVGVYVSGFGQWVGTDTSIYGRDGQAGGLVETGVRLKGPAGAIDLFLGYEHRVDAAAFDLAPENWIFIGFRLVGGQTP